MDLTASLVSLTLYLCKLFSELGHRLFSLDVIEALRLDITLEVFNLVLGIFELLFCGEGKFIILARIVVFFKKCLVIRLQLLIESVQLIVLLGELVNLLDVLINCGLDCVLLLGYILDLLGENVEILIQRIVPKNQILILLLQPALLALQHPDLVLRILTLLPESLDSLRQALNQLSVAFQLSNITLLLLHFLVFEQLILTLHDQRLLGLFLQVTDLLVSLCSGFDHL